jgi:signal transduction histidine kinase
VSLGLWIVSWAVRLSGGELDYVENDGAVLTIRLPAAYRRGRPRGCG